MHGLRRDEAPGAGGFVERERDLLHVGRAGRLSISTPRVLNVPSVCGVEPVSTLAGASCAPSDDTSDVDGGDLSDFSLRFLTRPGCHLCEDAEPVVRRAARLLAVPVTSVDIERDDEMTVDWGLRIPVVLDPRGRVLAEGHVELWPLVRRIAAARVGIGGP